MISAFSRSARQHCGRSVSARHVLMRSAAPLLLLAVLLLACAPLGVSAAKLPLEQELLAEARADADSIVQHRRYVLRCKP